MAESANNERFENWMEHINRACGPFAGQLLDGGFQGSLQEYHANAMKLSVVDIAHARLFRTQHEVARGNDAWFYAVFQLDGESVLEQGSNQAVIRGGDITLIDASRPCSITYSQRAKQISLLVPRHLLEQNRRSGELPCAYRLNAEMPVVKMSQRLLHESMKNPTLSACESEAALEAIICLLRPVLQVRDALPSKRDKQLERVMGLIDNNIQSEELRPEWIAFEAGMSVRSLYRMFADKGLVVAQYIKNRRLDLCAQALRTVSSTEKLAGIGYNWGFTDHSHFSTAFKMRFGISPGEYRKRWQ
ncbi:transcriptional regulator FeaR [Buttiauxella sp. B2]|uniref:transcriptional regulator FeaR n=1 Tax=Buttiauxella sp. B2 TaxID=2587812 RepID=UPI00111DDF6C|nr:transcriptional regulator FeaR [Buttiauxella sp. B2]TNV22529.1 transcriptional regulator FeaR [Buttiauxella sp. B2]